MYYVMSAWHNQTALVPVASISQHLPINRALWGEGNMVVLNRASGSTVHILKRAYNIQLKIITLKIFIQTNIEVYNKEMETFELIVNKTDKIKKQNQCECFSCRFEKGRRFTVSLALHQSIFLQSWHLHVWQGCTICCQMIVIAVSI